MAMKIGSKGMIIAATASTLVFGVGGYIWKEEHRPAILEVYVFSLASGRSMLIRTPEDKRILVDGGANSDVIREISGVLPFYSRRIDTVIATNTDGKNVTGLIDVIHRYSVTDVYVTKHTVQSLGLATSTDETYRIFIDAVNSRKIALHEAVAGNTILLDSRVNMKVLFPVEPSGFKYSNASAPELLFRIDFGQTAMAFLGNASHKVQDFIASSTADLSTKSIDALIVSHSALPANMSIDLIRVWAPKYLLYSKEIKKGPAKSSPGASKKKSPAAQVEPMAGVMDGNRWNLREKGTAKIVSDGLKVFIR